jgi:hypothetical protein
MRILSACLVILLFSARAWAGGSAVVFVYNYLPPVDYAPVYDSDCTTRLSGTNYLCQVYGGLTTGSLEPTGPSLLSRLVCSPAIWI